MLDFAIGAWHRHCAKKHIFVWWKRLCLIPFFGWIVCEILLFKKSVKFCQNCGRKVAFDAIFCPYCATKLAESAKSVEQLQIVQKKRGKMFKFAAIVVCAAAFMLAIFFSVFSAFANSEPYKHSIELIESNAETQNWLGENYKRKGFFSGSINVSGDATGNAAMSYKLRGKNGVSRVYMQATKENGVWRYEKILFYKNANSDDAIDLIK